ncbi:MAG: HpcH/HpaI aldolase/citrate lyase family protein [Steroidobacteraceae bacterium]
MQTPHNPFKQALKAQQAQYGFWLGMCSPIAAELCGQCGYDWLLIDGEHAPNSIDSLYSQLLAVGNTPSHPVVRIVEGDTALIKQVLDIGAQSILVPMVESAEQARSIVTATRYPPAGVRGVGTALARAARWNGVQGYFRDVENELCVLAQVESVKGLAALDDILAVEGIDGVFIGPADLAASMGHLGNPSHPQVVTAVEDALRRIRAAGLAPGILVTSEALARRYEAAGALFVALGVDTLALAAAARSTLASHVAGEDLGNSASNGAY